MTNHVCPKCKVHNTNYYPDFGFYGCPECGHGWGGSLDGKNLNPAWYAFRRMEFWGTESEIVEAHEIIFDNLETIARALECNLGLKELPDNSQWWIEYQHDIEQKLLGIETPQDVLR